MGKVSSKNNRRSHKRTRMPVHRDPTKGRFTDATIAKSWNKKLTVKQNCELLGIASDMNTEARVSASRPLRINASNIGELLALIDSGAPVVASGTLEERNPTRAPHYVNAEERAYLKAVEAVHGRNFMAMQRDTKANSLQHSAAHLETRFTRLDKFEAAITNEASAAAGGMDVDEDGTAAPATKNNKGGKKKAPGGKTSASAVPVGEDFLDFAAKGLKSSKGSKGK